MSNVCKNDMDYLFEILPIFEVDGHDRLFFKDRSISELELHINTDVNEFMIIPLGYHNGTLKKFTFMIHYWTYDCRAWRGWIMVNNDIILPDSTCMLFYKHNLTVESMVRVEGYNQYDRTAIQRRAAIKEIIN